MVPTPFSYISYLWHHDKMMSVKHDRFILSDRKALMVVDALYHPGSAFDLQTIIIPNI